MAFFSPPPVPVVSVVSTLHCQCGTAFTMTPPASHTSGTTIAARPRKQRPQNTAFQIFLAADTRGQSSGSCRVCLNVPGGVTDADSLLMLPILVIAYRPDRKS